MDKTKNEMKISHYLISDTDWFRWPRSKVPDPDGRFWAPIMTMVRGMMDLRRAKQQTPPTPIKASS